MERFHEAYRHLGQLDSILAAACAHHRLLWIHPFIDGNGRVARMMSYAMLRRSLNTGGLWSVAGGLARQESQYKQHLAECDLPRHNDLDGCRTLSEEALASFTTFFMKTCIDQVTFMEDLMNPQKLCNRIIIWAEEQIRAGVLPQKSDIVLKSLLYQGELQRGEIAALLGMSDRAARRITSALVNMGVLTSPSSRMPLHIAFPIKFVNRWMPGLFPE